MPQLPGGRHVAINTTPLSALLGDAGNPGNVHKIMAIAAFKDLDAYIEVLFLVPAIAPAAQLPAPELRSGSMPCPPGLVLVDSGYRLSDWSELTQDWDEPDKTAFRDFLNGPAAALFAESMIEVRRTQEAMRVSPKFMTRLLTASCDCGCHPAQEGGWDASDVGSPEWDDYDLMAALGQMSALFSEGRLSAEDWRPEARLKAFWAIAREEIPQLVDWPLADKPVRSCAVQARAEGWLEPLDESNRRWVHEQGVIECVSLWNALGDGLRAMAPQPYGIIELVVVSPEANGCFEAPQPGNP